MNRACLVARRQVTAVYRHLLSTLRIIAMPFRRRHSILEPHAENPCRAKSRWAPSWVVQAKTYVSPCLFPSCTIASTNRPPTPSPW